ncbi:hypothetical protein D918_03294 [Trichuris suis]|nr:hypothetical protein D918_03294 [Trichuris suis]
MAVKTKTRSGVEFCVLFGVEIVEFHLWDIYERVKLGWKCTTSWQAAVMRKETSSNDALGSTFQESISFSLASSQLHQ